MVWTGMLWVEITDVPIGGWPLQDGQGVQKNDLEPRASTEQRGEDLNIKEFYCIQNEIVLLSHILLWLISGKIQELSREGR